MMSMFESHPFLILMIFAVCFFLSPMKNLTMFSNIIISTPVYNSLSLKKIFLFMIIFNSMSLIPYMFPLTSLPCVLLLSLMLWSSYYLPMLFFKFNNNVSHFLPLSAPMYMCFFLIIIEIISILARPMALSIRMMANLTAGHLLLHLFTMSLESNLYFMFILFLLLVFLECSVAFIQAYVYTMLLSLYTNEAM